MIPMLTLLMTAMQGPATLPAQTPANQSNDPAIQISLNNDGNYAPGSPVDVRVQTNDDGYLLVFRVDGDGAMHVLFPLDPGEDAFVRGGKEYALRGRDQGQTFFADDRAGDGMVYAALGHEPYNFHDVTANGHWDYEALRLPDSSTDAEGDITDMVARMTDRNRFDYDAVEYHVQEIGTVTASADEGYYPGYYDPYYNPSWRCLGCGWAYPGAAFSLGLDFGYSPFYDPFFYAPWGYAYTYYPRAYYGGGYFFPGSYPVVVSHPRRPYPAGGLPPRPRRGAVGVSGRAMAPSPGIRSRPRPEDMQHFVPRRYEQSSGRPQFREQQSRGNMMEHPRFQPPERPAYREPPQRSAPEARSAPPSRPSMRSAPPSRSGGGSRGGGPRGRH